MALVDRVVVVDRTGRYQSRLARAANGGDWVLQVDLRSTRECWHHRAALAKVEQADCVRGRLGRYHLEHPLSLAQET